jgi:monoamine oxidase
MTSAYNSNGVDCVVVGTGLSGLTTIRTMLESRSVTRLRTLYVLEANSGVGGRLRKSTNTGNKATDDDGKEPKTRSRAATISYNTPGIDLGGTWSWSTDTNLRKLARDMEIETIEQPWQGDIVQVSRGRRQTREARFGESPCGPGGVRFLDGGAAQLCEKMKDEIEDLRAANKVEWLFNTAATAIRRVDGDELEIDLSTGGKVRALCAVLACPPLAASNIAMTPPLPPKRLAALKNCQTWMGNVLKFVAVYDKAFWKDAGCSGFGVLGDDEDDDDECHVQTTWDASDCRTYAIAGFATPPREKNDDDKTARKIISDLRLMFGDKAGEGRVEFKDWSNENYNAPWPTDNDDLRAMHLEYGHSLLKMPHMDRVVFSGTETENQNGHIEGAIISGRRAANEAYSVLMSEQKKGMAADGVVYRK